MRGRGRACKQHHEAVQAKRDAAVRRGPALEAVQQVAELGLRFLLGEPDGLKHARLHISPVDAEAPACATSRNSQRTNHAVMDLGLSLYSVPSSGNAAQFNATQGHYTRKALEPCGSNIQGQAGEHLQCAV